GGRSDGDNMDAPDPSDGELVKGGGTGSASLIRPKKLDLSGGMGEVVRSPLLGGIRERSERPELQFGVADLKQIRKSLDKVVSEIRAKQEGEPGEAPELNDYQQHKL